MRVAVPYRWAAGLPGVRLAPDFTGDAPFALQQVHGEQVRLVDAEAPGDRLVEHLVGVLRGPEGLTERGHELLFISTLHYFIFRAKIFSA